MGPFNSAIASNTTIAGAIESSSICPSEYDVSRDEVLRVLTKLGGPWHLARTGLWQGRTFQNIEEAADAVLRANSEHCVYFLANAPKGGALRGRRREKDIGRVKAVFLDIDDPDPDLVSDLINRLDWRPTYVAFTGGGYQAMWRLSQTVTPSVGKQISVWLQMQFEDWSPDSTQSVDHLFRLPGTRNRKKGRNDNLVRFVHEDWEACLPVEEAGRAEVKRRPKAIAVDLKSISLPGELWEIIPPKAIQLISRPVDAKGKPFASRSEHEWAFIGACVRDQTPLDIINSLLLQPAQIGDVHLVSHRTHWAKVKGVFVRRHNPATHVSRQIGSFLAKGEDNEQR